MLLLVGNLGVHGVELDGAVEAGEELLLGVLGPHVLDEVLLGGGEVAGGERAIQLFFNPIVMLHQVGGQWRGTGEGLTAEITLVRVGWRWFLDLEDFGHDGSLFFEADFLPDQPTINYGLIQLPFSSRL